MSLPDTVFIFVLALIIFGPKKLPEIGRQIGKLVGEFRRASNEFKFQIEEELRQADWTEKTSSQPTIAAPAPTAPAELAETLPAGQHPNIENLDPSGLTPPEPNNFTSKTSEASETLETSDISDIKPGGAQPEPSSALVVTPAEGSLARTTVPFAAEAVTPEPEVSLPAAPASVHHASSPTEAEITHG